AGLSALCRRRDVRLHPCRFKHPPPPAIYPFPYTTLFRSRVGAEAGLLDQGGEAHFGEGVEPVVAGGAIGADGHAAPGGEHHRNRSEEHTSELQSHLNLVCRLLLEKKKTQRKRATLATPR